MTHLTLQITVRAPAERCFNLARSMDFHVWSMRATGERIVGGRATDLIGPGDEVEFEARHLGLTRRLRAKVTAFAPPTMFADEQVRGPFRSLVHTHSFEAQADGTVRITDLLAFHLGFGIAGLAVERLMIRPHLGRLLRGHQRNLKATAESDHWRNFITDGPV
ncbi:MAG: SRPBCC family protein [Phycisphaerales bacterium]|nr:SRPBCC family protein [Phycisphaerales bacterium]